MLVDSEIWPTTSEPIAPGGHGIIWRMSRSSASQSACETPLVPRMATANWVRSLWFWTTYIMWSW